MPLDRRMFADKLQRYAKQLQVDASELSQRTGIESPRMAALLAGSVDPSGDEVLILADFFLCDYRFFISNEKLAPFEQTELLFRRHGSDLTVEDRWAIQEFLFLCECQDFLLAHIPGAAKRPFTFVKHGNYYKGHGESAAGALRQHLGYAPDEVPGDVFSAFRRAGVHVFRRKLGRSAISGLFIRHPSAGPCVLVNYSEDLFRQRFTAAHEAGHSILDVGEEFVVSFANSDRNDRIELRANTFASRFLLPPASLKALPDGRRWDPSRFLDTAAKLMVNAETLAYALGNAGLIQPDQVDELKMLKVPPSAKSDPELPAALSPRDRERKESLLRRGLSDSYVHLCFEGYERGVITAARLAEMLLVAEFELPDLAQLYGRALSYGG